MEGKTRPIPVRLTAQNDSYLKEFMKGRGYNNRNLSLNLIIEEHKTMIGEYRGKAKNDALKLLRDYHIPISELE